MNIYVHVRIFYTMSNESIYELTIVNVYMLKAKTEK